MKNGGIIVNDKVNVFVEGFGEISVDKGTTFFELAKKIFGEKYNSYLGVRIENEIFNLHSTAKEGNRIKFIDISDNDGHRIYVRTLSAIYIKACKDLFPDCKVNIEHSLGKGLYTEINKQKPINFDEIQQIKDRMNEIIAEDIPIKRQKITKEEAIRIFEAQNNDDKVRLFKHVDKENIHVYKLDGHIDIFYGYVAPSAGYVKAFDLKYYYPGIILQYPNHDSNYLMPEFKENKKLAKIFKEAEDWADILDLGYVGSLNDKITDNSISEVIRISEAFHEKKVAFIADKICADKDINIILVAGPSSSGKTTFAHRLGVQLKVNGKRPISISMDDYFVDREKTPKNELGEYDFEAVEAIDIKLFNEDLIRLLEGEEVELPSYNFVLGKREASGVKVRVDQDHPIIIEGIHGLNSKLTSYIPEKNKFKIYISALTQLNIDSHNRIPTTDTRIIRRMVRDYKYRGNDVLRTFKLWESVRRGEEKNIFPFQEEADIMFNSALSYELAVLKKYAVPLLKTVGCDSEYYSEAKRLLKFLYYFKSVEDESIIPPNSILREFIGLNGFQKR